MTLLSSNNRYESECCYRNGDHGVSDRGEGGGDVSVPCGGNVFSSHVCRHRSQGARARVDSDGHRHDAVDSVGTSVAHGVVGAGDDDHAYAYGGSDDVHDRSGRILVAYPDHQHAVHVP